MSRLRRSGQPTIITLHKGVKGSYLCDVRGRFGGGFRAANFSKDLATAAARLCSMICWYGSVNPHGHFVVAPPEIVSLVPPHLLHANQIWKR